MTAAISTRAARVWQGAWVDVTVGTRLLGGLVALASAALVLAGQYRPVEQSPLLGLAVGMVAAAAAAPAGYLVIVRPWWGLLAWLALMPVMNAARAQLYLGPVQLIATTPGALGLVLGTAIWRGRLAPAERPNVPAVAWGLLAVAAALAVVATVAAPISSESINITLHGVLVPFAVFGAVLAMRPDPRAVVQAVAALAFGIISAAMVNLAYLFGTIGPSSFYERRFLYARLTYFNTGIFGGMLVAGMVHLCVVLIARARMGWSRCVAPVTWGAMAIAVVAVFFTYTKSAWVAGAVGQIGRAHV